MEAVHAVLAFLHDATWPGALLGIVLGTVGLLCLTVLALVVVVLGALILAGIFHV